MASPNNDDARLLAALAIAVSSMPEGGRRGESFEGGLDCLADAMRGRYWQITVARDLKLSIFAWINRPWHCWKLRALCRALLQECAEPSKEAQAIQLLTRCSAVVEFGVDVNAKWYRRLRETVARGEITTSELRSLLSCLTVWWGVAPSPRAENGGLPSVPSRIWRMGRPADGELLVSDHHWVTKALLLMILIPSGMALAVLTLGGAQQLVAQGATPALISIVIAWFTFGLFFWASWWCGPHSWTAVRRLRRTLNMTVQESERMSSGSPQ